MAHWKTTAAFCFAALAACGARIFPNHAAWLQPLAESATALGGYLAADGRVKS